MFDSHNRAQPDWNEYEHVLCRRVHSSAGRCWLDLLHTRCPQALSPLGPDSVGFIAPTLHQTCTLAALWRAITELQMRLEAREGGKGCKGSGICWITQKIRLLQMHSLHVSLLGRTSFQRA